MNRLVETKELKTDYWEKLAKEEGVKPILRYDESLDTLYIYFSPRETEKVITHFIDSQVALLYRHSDKEIIGMMIEAFEKNFLPEVNITKVWKLSDVVRPGIEGVCDIVFVVERVGKRKIPDRIQREIKAIEPVFA